MPDDESKESERRRWVRFRGDISPVKIIVPGGQEHLGRLVDESFGGLGVDLESVDGLKPGMDVLLEYKETKEKAELRVIIPRKDGLFRIGFQWQDTVSLGDSTLFPE